MKLGIAVVYLVSEENEKLLDLHLDYIDKHTTVPYRIYGSSNRLLPKYRQRLERHPHVEVCDCEPTELRGLYEHAYYLEKLVRRAVDDGATHVAVFHVDSFPIRSGWAEELAAKLDERCVLLAAMNDEKRERRPNTCFMLFERDFYLEHRPTFVAADEIFETEEYEHYVEEFPHRARDSGIGYGFTIFRAGLTWHPLAKSNRAGEDSFFGTIHGDLIFHLGAAAGPLKLYPGAERAKTYRFRRLLTSLVPEMVRKRIRGMPRRIKDYLYPDLLLREAQFARARRRLFEDPEGYFHYLQTGEGSVEGPASGVRS